MNEEQVTSLGVEKNGAGDEPLFPSFILKHLYAEMLQTFTTAEVVEFWSQLPFTDPQGRRLDKADIFRCLWEGNNFYHGASIFVQCRNLLYPFLTNRGIRLGEFLDQAASRLKECSENSARHYLVLLKPYFNLIFGGGDNRQILLKVMHDLYKGLGFPGNMRLVGQNVKLGRRSDIMLFSWDDQFQERRDLDFVNMGLPWVRSVPELLGLPRYDEYKLLSDYRDPAAFLPDFKVEHGVCYSQGSEVGKVVKFSEFISERHLVLDFLQIPDADCLVLDQDLRASDGSVVLYSGCLYRAPVVLVNMTYDSIRKHHGNPLEVLVDALLTQENSYWRQIQEKHNALLKDLEEVVEVVYHVENESITVDNRHLVRSMPAKILRNIFREYSDSGRLEFENLEFKRDPEITLDVNNPNFEGRLSRLINKLEKEDSRFLLQKEERGRFSLLPKAKITFREE